MRARCSGRILAIGLAYLLAMEALIASVGMGMSAVATAGQHEFVICSSIGDHGFVAPSRIDHQNKSDCQPQCPFCFVAAQNAVHLASIGDGLTSPAYAELQIKDLHYGDYNGGIRVPVFYRTTGDPRGPPQFSV
jgi:hypothetical protein